MSSSLQEIVLTSSPDRPITAYDVSSGATLAHFNGSRSPRKGLVLVGNKLIAASHVSSDTGTGSVYLYNWWSSTAFHQLPVPEPVAPLAATLDGSYLFAGGLSGRIYVLFLPSWDVSLLFVAHRKPVSCLEINEDGSLLFSGSDDGTIAVFPIYKLLDVSSHKNSNDNILHRFIGHDSSVTAIATGIGGCNCTIISCSLDCTCKFWSLAQGSHLKTITFPCSIWGVTMDPLESFFYVAGSDGFVYNGALKTASRKRVRQGNQLTRYGQKHGGPVVAMAMVNGGQNLVTASEDGSVWIWEIERGEVIKVLGKKEGSVSDLVVAKGFGNGGVREISMNGSNAEISEGIGLGYSGEELRRPIREVIEMEKVLNVVEKDRSRAIGTLESTIGIYEKLLELIIKEAKAAATNTSTNVAEKDDL